MYACFLYNSFIRYRDITNNERAAVLRHML